ncbi:hypothetical protein AYI70_g10464 [Smittium culicis]|uniref:Uncharacterized protein n=1 Tax=Smittium culicis TaxID=133412 RepID=A0A1R1X6K0_9FUNG|nr:hypothetical protein AYI70_g10464 [Smittium culicis]
MVMTRSQKEEVRDGFIIGNQPNIKIKPRSSSTLNRKRINITENKDIDTKESSINTVSDKDTSGINEQKDSAEMPRIPQFRFSSKFYNYTEPNMLVSLNKPAVETNIMSAERHDNSKITGNQKSKNGIVHRIPQRKVHKSLNELFSVLIDNKKDEVSNQREYSSYGKANYEESASRESDISSTLVNIPYIKPQNVSGFNDINKKLEGLQMMIEELRDHALQGYSLRKASEFKGTLPSYSNEICPVCSDINKNSGDFLKNKNCFSISREKTVDAGFEKSKGSDLGRKSLAKKDNLEESTVSMNKIYSKFKNLSIGKGIASDLNDEVADSTGRRERREIIRPEEEKLEELIESIIKPEIRPKGSANLSLIGRYNDNFVSQRIYKPFGIVPKIENLKAALLTQSELLIPIRTNSIRGFEQTLTGINGNFSKLFIDSKEPIDLSSLGKEKSSVIKNSIKSTIKSYRHLQADLNDICPYISLQFESALSIVNFNHTMRTEALQQHVLDTILHAVFGTANDFAKIPLVYDRNKIDTSLTVAGKRPDFVCWHKDLLVFKGEEKKKGDVRKIALELVDKMKPESIGNGPNQLPYLLSYATAGNDVLFFAINRKNKLVEVSDVLDMSSVRDRITILLILINSVRIIGEIVKTAKL